MKLSARFLLPVPPLLRVKRGRPRPARPRRVPPAAAASGPSRNRGRARGAPPGPGALPGAEQSGRAASHGTATLMLCIGGWVVPRPPALIHAQPLSPQILRPAPAWQEGLGPAGHSSTAGTAPCPGWALGASRRGTGQRAAALVLWMGGWGHG